MPISSQNIRGVKVEGRRNFESMASVLAILAYPSSEKAKARFEKAIVFQFARDIAKARLGWGQTFSLPADDLPYGNPDETAEAGYRILENDRLLAGDIALGYSVMPYGKKPELQGGKFGVNRVLEVASAQGAFKSASTGYAYWKASRQVVHLAVAYKLSRQRSKSDSVYELLEMPDGARTLIDTATHVKGLLLSLVGPKDGPTAIPDFNSFGMLDINAQ